jgi:uncharacterized membrane protein YqjE
VSRNHSTGPERTASSYGGTWRVVGFAAFFLVAAVAWAISPERVGGGATAGVLALLGAIGLVWTVWVLGRRE